MSRAQAVERSEILHRTPSLLNLVIENIPAMVAVKEARDLRFVLINRAGEELTGIYRHQSLGKNDFDMFPSQQAEFFVARDREVLASGKMLIIPEEFITTRHKGIRTLRTVKMPVFDESGNAQYLLAMSEDITEQKRAEAALAASERRWAFALESAEQGVWEADIPNNKVYCSPMWKKIRGFDLDEEVGSDLEAWLERVHPDDRSRVRESIAKQNIGEIPRSAIEYRERHKSGHYIWISSKGAADTWDAEGRPIHMIGTDTDITARKEQEQELQALTHRLEVALRVARIGVFEGNLRSGELFWDQRVREIFGVPDTHTKLLTGVDWEQALHPEDAPQTLLALSEALAAKTTLRQKYRIVRPDGEIRTIAADAAYHEAADGTPQLIGANADITEEVALAESLRAARALAEARNIELEAARARIEKQSLHDALTGLPNRRYLDDVIAGFVERGHDDLSGIAVLHIDLDRFKQINDTLGHNAGDAVLKHVANLLSEAAGVGSFVARVGGDEFVVVCLNEVDPQRLSALAERIIVAVQHPIPYEGHFCRVGTSIGIAIETGTVIDPRRVLINGDMALYRAKQHGRGRIEFFSKELQQELEANKHLADDILRGIEEAEFIPFYQPVVDAQTFKPVGVEALVRWQHPTAGILAPHRFLKIAEDINVLANIDRDILTAALRDLDNWRHAGLPVQSVSVNVSFRRLSDENLVSSLQQLDIVPGTLAFEFLESIFLDELDDRVAWNVDAIKEMGIGIDVDDFGTGHTSFVSLLRLMPRRFKIDRQLIGPVATSTGQRRLVASIVDIGRTLGIKVVAEGVETMEQAETLREIGCDFLQGYAFAAPMPAAELERWLLRSSAIHNVAKSH